MAAAPFNMPHAIPVERISGLPGIRLHAHPHKSKIAATSTNREMDMRIDSAGTLASRYTPIGVAKRDPASNQRKECQSISLQTCGTNLILARTSRIRTRGTTWTGGSTNDILVTETIANPKPL
jgi:hypothetical protein